MGPRRGGIGVAIVMDSGTLAAVVFGGIEVVSVCGGWVSERMLGRRRAMSKQVRSAVAVVDSKLREWRSIKRAAKKGC